MFARLVLMSCLVACGSKAAPSPSSPSPKAGTEAPTQGTAISNTASPAKGLAIAIVINGQEIWIGNDDFEQDENARYEGAFHSLVAGLDRAVVLPPDTQMAILSYSTGVEVLVPWTAAGSLKGSVLKNQKAFMSRIGTDMVPGITMAISELGKVTAARKVLVVIGDGNDTNNETATKELPQLAKDADAARIERHALIWKSAVSSEGEVVSKFAPKPRVVSNTQNLVAELEAIFQKAAAPAP